MEESPSPLAKDVKSIFSNNDKKDMCDLESSCEIESSEELYIHQPLFQNGKRCGIIFVATEDIKDQKASFGKFTNYIRLNTNNNWREPQVIYSFVVVCGKTSNIWSFPKGRMQSETESEEDCAIREVYEETGFKLQTVEGLPRITIGRNVYFIYHTTKQQISNFTIYDNYEVGEVSWKTMDELKSLTCNKDIRAILKYPYKRQSYHEIIFSKHKMGKLDDCYRYPRFIKNEYRSRMINNILQVY